MRDWGKVLRFCIVGAGVAGLYIGLYLTLLSIGMAQVWANALSFLIAVAVQYVGQAAFTFEKPLRDAKQMMRFGVMTGIGLLTASVITGLIGPLLHLSIFTSAVLVALFLPIQNYILMALWVFSTQRPKMDSLT